ncbi:hypothetical protein BH23VER1_BH23VER1_03900 [soil metagenome]
MHTAFNLAEGVLWILVAFITLRLPARSRRERLVVFVAFFAFGVSDFIEIQTGAWWRPWWLLAMKAACFLAFTPPLYRHLRRHLAAKERRHRED